jgi:hypothetical protein
MKRERQREGRTDDVEEELMIMGIRKWNKAAGGQKELRRNVMEARVQIGEQCL